jgi:predicted phage baseplate assembly protein
VAAGEISQLATHPPGAQGVINPLGASGGADRDSAGQARANTPMATLALDRLVGTVDYANFSRTFAGIGKASATRISDGRRLMVHVTIAGAEDIPIDPTSDLYQNLVQALHQFGDPALAIQVAVRKLKLLVISAGVSLLADYQWESVEPKIRAAVLDVFSFDRRALGQSAFLSELVSVIQAVEGVSYVNPQTFDAVGEDVTAAQLASLASALKLNNAIHAQLARIDQNATLPAQRMLPAELVILTPDIPDTLLLTEIKG